MVLANWDETIRSLPGILTVTFLFGGWIIVAIISSLAKNWRRAHEVETTAALKQSMIERGMSVDEIERVLRAGPPRIEKDGGGDGATDLAGKLVEHELPAKDMEPILTAFRCAEPGALKSLAKTIEVMLDGGANGEQVLAALRALGGSNAAQANNGQFRDSPIPFHN
jgi:hypothetical protein